MYELKKKLEIYLRVNLLEPGPRLMKKEFSRAAISQRLRKTDVEQFPDKINCVTSHLIGYILEYLFTLFSIPWKNTFQHLHQMISH